MPTAPPSLLQFVGLIVRVGLTSFGGGISGWMLRLVVQERAWMTEAEFIAGLGVCQVFPGINVVNLAIWLGYRMHGNKGAVIGALAMVVPPGIVIIGIVSLFGRVADVAWVHTALAGVAAAAIGLGASMGMRAARRCLAPVPAVLMAATFVGVGLLHWPMYWVLLAVAPISVAHAWRAA